MDQIKRLIASLSVRQRWTVLIVGILAAAGFYGLAHWETEAGFRPLYNSLAPEDAAVVVQKLKESGTPYRLSSNNSWRLIFTAQTSVQLPQSEEA